MSARRAFLSRTAAALAALALPAFAAAGMDPTAADWKAIRRVITSQRAALRAGKARDAYAFASDAIQRQFGDAERFLAMVREGYAALLDARYTEFLEGAVIDGGVMQPLRLVAPDNTVKVALYRMEKSNGRWRIGGCVLAPSTVTAA